MKKVIREGSEKAGIDDDYLADQETKYKGYREERECGGNPLPSGIGVMMWDEAKVRILVISSAEKRGVCILLFLRQLLKGN